MTAHEQGGPSTVQRHSLDTETHLDWSTARRSNGGVGYEGFQDTGERPSTTPPARIAGGAPNPASRPRPAARRRKPDSERRTSEAYFDAAFALLAEHGQDGVTIANLCGRLGVTKGSFYYHFTDMPEFVESFAEYWEASVASLLAAALNVEDPLAKMGAMMTAVANLSHEAEAALRAWGHSNPVIEASRMRIDEGAELVIGAIASEFIDDPDEVDLLAHQAVALAIGLQHRRRPIDRLLYLRAIAKLAEMTCHVVAEFTDARPEGVVSVRFTRRPGEASNW
jgi:AcrR family transcriptional regulator